MPEQDPFQYPPPTQTDHSEEDFSGRPVEGEIPTESRRQLVLLPPKTTG